ncbi:hypothetical protein NM22_07495 [Vibrio tubiashii]|nr:hypothetical protein NM22_07495 [Vibrio tubiashii]
MLQVKKGYMLAAFPLFYLLLVSRASLDPVLNFTKVGGIGVGAVLNLALVFIFFLLFIKRQDVPKVFFVPWIVFSAVTVLSSFWSPDLVNSLRSSFWILTYMSAFFIPFYFSEPRRCYESVLYLVILSFAIPLAVGLLEIATNLSAIASGEHRIKSTFSHANILAFYLTQVLFAVLAVRAMALKERWNIFGSYVGLAMIGLVCIMVIFTQTRSAWGVMLILIGTHCLVNERRLILPMVLCGLMLAAFPPVTERILDSLSSAETYYDPYAQLNSFEWRLVVWKSAMPWIADNVWLGYGFNSFGHYFLDFVQLEEDSSFDAHNMYVQYLFDMGLVGLISYLALAFVSIYFLVIGRQRHVTGTLVLVCFVSYSICGITDNISFYLSFNWYFWLVIGAYLSFVYREVVER